MSEPSWQDGCAGSGKKPGEECKDCIVQRERFGYKLVDGQWVKS